MRFVADGVIRAIVMEHRIRAGARGPEPVQLDVRAYLVAHASGVILVDTGMDAVGQPGGGPAGTEPAGGPGCDRADAGIRIAWAHPGPPELRRRITGVLLVGDCLGVVAGRLYAHPNGSPPTSKSPSRPSVACLCGAVPGCFSRMVPSWPAPGMSWRCCWNAEETGAVTLPERCGYSVRFVSDGVTAPRLTAPVGARESR